MPIDDGGPAFPAVGNTLIEQPFAQGMSLRAYLASHAPPVRELVEVHSVDDLAQVCIALGIPSPPSPDPTDLAAWMNHGMKFCAAIKVKWADAMIAALKETK